MAVVTAAVAAAVEDGSPSKRFWKKLKKETLFASYSPFIVCLAAGNLDIDVFRRFVSQDVFFQKAFVHAYEVAEECADDDDAKAEIADLRNAVLRRQKMHTAVLEEWGVDLAKEITATPATVRFTEFLQATTAGKVDGGKIPSKIATPFEKTKVAAYIIGAMTPCMRLYSFLVKELQTFMQPEDSYHTYKNWIASFSSTAFKAARIENEELLDKLSISLTGEELQVVEKLYSQAMKAEIEFFHAQPVVQQNVVPLVSWLKRLELRSVMCFDFDLTCSVVDSSAILAEIAVLTARKATSTDSDQLNEQTSHVDLRNSWNDLSTLYTEEYEQCIETILLTENVGGFNYEGLCKALELLSDFEKRADSRFIESGVLKGLNLEDLKRAGEHMIIQDGCLEFLQKIVKMKELIVGTHVISYCWCGDLIRSAFSAVGGFNYEGLCKALELLSDFEKRADSRFIESGVLKGLNLEDLKRAGEHMIIQDGCLEFLQKIVKMKELIVGTHVISYCWCGDLIRSAFSAGGLGALEVHSNELDFYESCSTGDIIRKVESPLDKVAIFKSILEGSSGNSGKPFTVYIGDSVGDLLCLLEADVGIVVGMSVSLRKVGAQFGVSFVPLFPELVKKQRLLADEGAPVWKGLSGVLYTVSNWAEIHAFVLGA